MAEPLADRVIAIAESRELWLEVPDAGDVTAVLPSLESRELDVFAALLERRGARVLRYPLVRIVDAPDPAPVLSWLRAFAGGGCDDLILLTGEGLRRMLRCIELHEPALRAPFLVALGGVRKITRGPKPARALRELGLGSDLAAEPPTTSGVIETLAGLDWHGRRVGVQLYGEEPNRVLIEFLQAAGAQVSSVAPYRYAKAASDSAVRDLLLRLRAGHIDAIAFTSKAQVERLFGLAPEDSVRWPRPRSQRSVRSWPKRWQRTGSPSAPCRKAPGS